MIHLFFQRQKWCTDTVNGQIILSAQHHVEMELGFEQENAWGIFAMAHLLRQSLAIT